MKIAILAGGLGTRLWPLSTEEKPKQFVKFDFLGNKSLLQATFDRTLKLVEKNNIYVLASRANKEKILNQIPISEENVITEPMMRNTLPAIIYGMKKLKDDVLFLPSDHYIQNDDEFVKAVKEGKKHMNDYLVIFGIVPTYASTGYGYIKHKNGIVENFREKPSKELAEQFVKEGYLWNSGMFLFSKKMFEQELKKHQPKMYELYSNEDLDEHYEELDAVSVDFGLLEKSDKIFVIESKLKWSDIGSLDSLVEFSKGSEKIELSSKGNSALTNKLTCFIGVDDLIVVETEEVILVCKKGESQKVKELYKIIKQRN